MEYKIGLIGCGTVGQGFLEILLQKKKLLKDEFDFEAKLVAVSDKLKGSLLLPEGIEIDKLLSLLKSGENIGGYLEGKPNEAENQDAVEIIEQCDADIIAELTYTDIQTAEPATSHVKKALQTGKHVVTSNKGPAALFYDELKTLAEQSNRCFKIEGTVMSGTPVFNLCANAFAGNEIKEINGILNGTTNFILTKMEEEGMDYEDALKLAQELGYAEADPTADVEGYDALAKIVILSNVLLDGNIKPSDAAREGITTLSKDKIQGAKKEGYRYKLISSTRKENGRIVACVSPQKLPLSNPLSGIMGANNALTFDLDLLGKVTIQGPGAGKKETGYSILVDMLAIHRHYSK